MSSLNGISTPNLRKILNKGPLSLRIHQRPPLQADWRTWLLLGGRGSGKTRAGSEWVQGLATGTRPFANKLTGPIALIGETFADVREVMIDGPSGIRNCALYDRPTFEPSRRRLVWSSGMVAHIYSAHDPESLRGPQFSTAWCDARTIWASIVSIAASLAAFLGVPLDDAIRANLTDTLLQLVTAAAGVTAILGRLTASSKIVR